MNDLKSRLRNLREQNKLTRKQLGGRISASHDQIYNWETGRGAPDVQTLGKIAAMLRVKTDWLLGKVASPIDPLVPSRPAEASDFFTENIGENFLQAANPAYNRTEKTDNIKIIGKVKKMVRQY